MATAPLRLAQRTGADRLLARTGLIGRVSPAAEQALLLAPESRPTPPGRLPERVAALGTRRAVVGMLTGCVQSVFFPGVNAATARVLAAEGCDVIIPRSQGCCGALSLHSGRVAEAAKFARQTIAVFEAAGVDAIVVNSAGCGSAMKEYERLFAGLAEKGAEDEEATATASPALPGQLEAGSWAARAALLSSRVRDLSEFLDTLGPVAVRRPVPVVAAYHDACHLGHAQGITAQPRSLLRAIPGLELIELRDAGVCCGSAGVYNLLQPDAASALGARKADSVEASGRLPAHLDQPRLHPADLGRAGVFGRDDQDRAHRRGSGRLHQRRTARLILGRIRGRRIRARRILALKYRECAPERHRRTLVRSLAGVVAASEGGSPQGIRRGRTLFPGVICIPLSPRSLIGISRLAGGSGGDTLQGCVT